MIRRPGQVTSRRGDRSLYQTHSKPRRPREANFTPDFHLYQSWRRSSIVTNSLFGLSLTRYQANHCQLIQNRAADSSRASHSYSMAVEGLATLRVDFDPHLLQSTAASEPSSPQVGLMVALFEAYLPAHGVGVSHPSIIVYLPLVKPLCVDVRQSPSDASDQLRRLQTVQTPFQEIFPSYIFKAVFKSGNRRGH